MEGDQRQREEMEQVRLELRLEQEEEANRQREIVSDRKATTAAHVPHPCWGKVSRRTFIQQEAMEKKIRQRMVMERAYQEALAFKEMRTQAEREEEDGYRRRMMAKFAEDDRIDQMNAQRRRLKQLEHKREVERLIEDRRRQHEAEKVPQTLSTDPELVLKSPKINNIDNSMNVS